MLAQSEAPLPSTQPSLISSLCRCFQNPETPHPRFPGTPSSQDFEGRWDLIAETAVKIFQTCLNDATSHPSIQMSPYPRWKIRPSHASSEKMLKKLICTP